MVQMLDLNLLPLLRHGGLDQHELPGLFLATPPRRAARSRSEDRLILFLSLTGNAPLTGGQQIQILSRLAQIYYKKPGSVTAALRHIADHLNQFLLDRNVRSSSSGQQGVGLLTMAVLRGDKLILGQSGPAHTFVIQPNAVQEFFDPQTSGRGLGLTRSVPIRFYQVSLQPGDVMIFTPQPPSGWTPQNLKQVQNQGMESLRRRLLNQAGKDVQAVVVLSLPGEGKLRLMRHRPPQSMAQPSESFAPAVEGEGNGKPVAQESAAAGEKESPVQQVDSPQPETRVAPTEEASEANIGAAAADDRIEELPIVAATESDSLAVPEEELAAGPHEAELPVSGPAEVDITPSAEEPIQKPAVIQSFSEISPARKRRKAHAKIAHETIHQISDDITKAGRYLARMLYLLLKGFSTLLKKVLPDESLFTIPASTMAFSAIAVAVVVATVGGVVYFERGRAAQYEIYYQQALSAADAALSQTEPIEIRTAWETVLDFLDRAENFKATPDSEFLRSHAISALDKLDYVHRLDFQPALSGGLGSAEITKMVATTSEIYMLNGKNGTVLRATRTGQGFDIDPNFICGPNPNVGPLIDITALPKSPDQQATLVGIDAHGTLEYCFPDSLPIAHAAAPPQSGWGGLKAFDLNGKDFYVLDPQTNAVWIYWSMLITQQPHLFFGDEIPMMKNVIDLTVNQDDLYLLHDDGSLTTCVYSSLNASPTRCEDPATLTDPRPGRQSGPRILDAQFSQILYTPPPDASIFLLDPVHKSLYHFSLRLNFQKQYRSSTELPIENATAFTISPNRLVFMAVGDQVYYAALP